MQTVAMMEPSVKMPQREMHETALPRLMTSQRIEFDIRGTAEKGDVLEESIPDLVIAGHAELAAKHAQLAQCGPHPERIRARLESRGKDQQGGNRTVHPPCPASVEIRHQRITHRIVDIHLVCVLRVFDAGAHGRAVLQCGDHVGREFETHEVYR